MVPVVIHKHLILPKCATDKPLLVAEVMAFPHWAPVQASELFLVGLGKSCYLQHTLCILARIDLP